MIRMILLLAVPLVLLAASARSDTSSAPVDDPKAAVRTEFESRFAALSTAQLDDAIALAQWAIDEELLDEADRVYRAILRAEPEHADAYAALRALATVRPLPKTSEALDRARVIAPESFREYETRRYVILSDADPAWIRVQSRRLERAHDEFFRFAIGLDLRPRPVRHKLVAVVFDDRSGFASFAKHDGRASVDRVAGYYSAPTDRLVFYHVESNENLLAARSELESLYDEAALVQRQARSAGMRGRRGQASEIRADLERQYAHLDERERAINIFAHERSVAVTVHEAVHQLMFHTGVQSPRVAHPMWLTEGLATAFETDATGSAFGPTREFASRREAFWTLLDNDRVMPLRELIALTPRRVQGNPRNVDVVYNQGYALVTWMCRHRKLELRRYLRALNALPGGTPSAADQLEAFTAAFGDIDRIEKAWLRHERAQ